MKEFGRFLGGLLGSADNRLQELQAKLANPIFKRRGIEMVVTHSREERIKLLETQLAMICIEGGGITEINAALGGDDGDLDEFAIAFHKDIDILLDAQHFKINVTSVPEGEAPQEHRKWWRGTEMMAVKELSGKGDRGLVTKTPLENRGECFVVSTRQAIKALQEKSPIAAKYFREHTKDIPFLSFRADEVEATAITRDNRQLVDAVREVIHQSD
ncbi:MAG: hypothetical protein V1858_01890 [Candidatus Gottesmanbacteria bacterium]